LGIAEVSRQTCEQRYVGFADGLGEPEFLSDFHAFNGHAQSS
jgi:hypothetical protein